MASNLKDSSQVNSRKMENCNVHNGYNELMTSQQTKINASCDLPSKVHHLDKRKICQQNGEPVFKSTIAIGELKKVVSVSEEIDGHYKTRHDHNGSIANGKHAQNGSIANGKHAQNGSIVNGKHAQNGSSDNCEHAGNGLTAKNIQTVINGKYLTEEQFNKNYDESTPLPCSKTHQEFIMCNNGLVCNGLDSNVSVQNGKRLQNSVIVKDHLTAEDLQSLFTDQICVLHIPNYIPQVVCDTLDGFLQEKGSDPYTHEIRDKDGTADLQYFGVNRYGFPLNSTYNDGTGDSLERYFSEALPTMQAIRLATAPYISPIDKLRVEMDELWSGNVNVATLNGRKTFCGIGRIMPAVLSDLSADQPHFDSVPQSYFPNIRKQFAANIYLNVPGEGGELEIWDVPPVDVDNVEGFTIPDDWRSKLPESIKVKPGPGDLLLLNTRRPHAITKFAGIKPRTSIQTFIGLTKDSNVFLWV